MEPSGLKELSMYLDQELFLLPEDKKNLLPTSPSPVQQQPVPEEEPEYPTLSYEGNFEKGVLVVYEGFSLPKPLTELLLKILDAVGCSLKDIALVSSASVEGVPIQSVFDMDPNKVILFGSFRHELMALKTGTYQITQQGGIEYLFADAISVISDDQQLKRLLWNELQVLFNITKK
jgi:hypothetical protein